MSAENIVTEPGLVCVIRRTDEEAVVEGVEDGRPIEVGVESGGYGVWLFARDREGKSLCEVKLDYFNNKLQVVAFDLRAAARDDEPSHIIPLVGDVAAAMRTTADERYELLEAGRPIPGE